MSEALPLPNGTATAFQPAGLRVASGLAEIARRSRSREATLEWLAMAERTAQFVDLDATAHIHGAMLRRRGVPNAGNLLCLALMHGPGGMALRLVAERAAELDIAHVTEPALLRRLLNAATWLEHIADTLIIENLLRRTDAMTTPGHKGSALGLRSFHYWQDAALSAKQFLVDFVPWQDDSFNDSQAHWLLCTRWSFVASTIKDGPMFRADPAAATSSTLERGRLMAHLIAALVPTEG